LQRQQFELLKPTKNIYISLKLKRVGFLGHFWFCVNLFSVEQAWLWQNIV